MRYMLGMDKSAKFRTRFQSMRKYQIMNKLNELIGERCYQLAFLKKKEIDILRYVNSILMTLKCINKPITLLPASVDTE